MADQVRVLELAREAGVPVREVLARLAEHGVIVRRGKSTVTEPVARWLRESYGLRPAAVDEKPAKTAGRRKKRPEQPASVRRWGIPVVSKEQAAESEAHRRARRRAVDPEMVRKRVEEILGTSERSRPNTPAKNTSAGGRQGRPTKATNGGAQSRKTPRTLPGPETWKCPNCVKRIDVDSRGAALVDHLNARGQRCAGSGYLLPEKSTDALDYRVAGSFEGGRRGRR